VNTYSEQLIGQVNATLATSRRRQFVSFTSNSSSFFVFRCQLHHIATNQASVTTKDEGH